jgi:hypothetical protein
MFEKKKTKLTGVFLELVFRSRIPGEKANVYLEVEEKNKLLKWSKNLFSIDDKKTICHFWTTTSVYTRIRSENIIEFYNRKKKYLLNYDKNTVDIQTAFWKELEEPI